MKSQDIFLALKLVALDLRNKGVRGDEPAPAKGIPIRRRDPQEPWSDWSDSSEDAIAELFPLPAASEGPYRLRDLAEMTGLSKSEVSNALGRIVESGLGAPRGIGAFSVNYRGLQEFLVYGVRYVFPVRMQEFTRGIATGLTAPVFNGVLKGAVDQVPVWPDPRGNTSGLAIEPLFHTVPKAVRQDRLLYELLALVDSIRMGLPRERNLATSLLVDLLKN